MSTLPLTTTLLLAQICDPQHTDAWTEFDRRYRPVLIGFGRGLGLSHEDAADMAQWTLADLAKALSKGRYDRHRGRLRSWIMGIARNRAARIVGIRAHARLSPQDLEAITDETMADLWDKARHKALLEHALALLRDTSRFAPATLAAFELVALRGVPAVEVASLCGFAGPDDVHVARCRVTRRLREIVADLEHLYDEAG
jgi:DNA-directed RNA polymerase specialized sigma24 family protein